MLNFRRVLSNYPADKTQNTKSNLILCMTLRWLSFLTNGCNNSCSSLYHILCRCHYFTNLIFLYHLVYCRIFRPLGRSVIFYKSDIMNIILSYFRSISIIYLLFYLRSHFIEFFFLCWKNATKKKRARDERSCDDSLIHWAMGLWLLS